MITLILHSKPVSWAAPITHNRIHFNPKHREKLDTMALVKQLYNGPLFDEYMVLEFEFRVALPASASKKKKMLMLEGEIVPTKCDCTNYQKFYEDCLKKIVLTDDRLVAKISSRKLYAEKECIIISIETLKEHNARNH